MVQPVVNHLHILRRGLAVLVEDHSPASAKTSSITTKKLFERYDSDHLMTDYLKPIHSIFCRSTV